MWSLEPCQHQPGSCYPGAGGLGGLGDVTCAPGFPRGAAFGEIGKPGLLSCSRLGWTSLEALRALRFPSAVSLGIFPGRPRSAGACLGQHREEERGRGKGFTTTESSPGCLESGLLGSSGSRFI